MTAEQMRNKYFEFFRERGHSLIASASLLPENDPSVLFTTAGMHPLVPYLLGERHPMGKRLVNAQKCIRTDDIDDVGDASHHTYFEMLGNWSLGDYFKKESIRMSYDFLTRVLGIPADRLAVTVFEGHALIPKDTEAYDYWKDVGLRDSQIYFYGMDENWWGPAGATGPCGPDTEIFYDTGALSCNDECGPACKCGKFVEIWNNVFMQYNKLADGSYVLLDQQNVDTGMGLERIVAVLNGQASVYETDMLAPIVKKIEELTGVAYSDWVGEAGVAGSSVGNVREFRIIADHMRAAVFILGDYKKVVPSNTEQGYILRRLIRRAIRLLRQLAAGADPQSCLSAIADVVISINANVYPELLENRDFIIEQLEKECAIFLRTLERGLKEAEKVLGRLEAGGTLAGGEVFRLFDTFGFPPELTEELAAEKGAAADIEGFKQHLAQHQEKSRSGARGMFKGGLADHSDQTARLHTATHLLNGALRTVLGDGVMQRGSNINAERLRFDFSFDRKMTAEEIEAVNKIVNRAIADSIDVVCEEMPVDAAAASGAVGVFESRYGEIVKVYTMGEYSKEICGGPHVANTGELVSFTIQKEESSSAGVRRIKATVGAQ
ncbi:MAG: alanine--tRNA ligase [Oscillospiraceae bacterium]|nr:alanine--tRNA ligase [Oscillospiraceae bacterium]